jgi:hypothetical protein
MVLPNDCLKVCHPPSVCSAASYMPISPFSVLVMMTVMSTALDGKPCDRVEVSEFAVSLRKYLREDRGINVCNEALFITIIRNTMGWLPTFAQLACRLFQRTLVCHIIDVLGDPNFPHLHPNYALYKFGAGINP